MHVMQTNQLTISNTMANIVAKKGKECKQQNSTEYTTHKKKQANISPTKRNINDGREQQRLEGKGAGGWRGFAVWFLLLKGLFWQRVKYISNSKFVDFC